MLLLASRADEPIPDRPVARVIPDPLKEELRVPPPPTVGGAVRAAVSDFYFNSLRLIPANIVWGAILLFAGALLFVSPGAALVVFLVILPLPTGALFRLAALIERDEPVGFSDALAWRKVAKRAIGAGLVIGAASLLLIFNIVSGYNSAEPVAWAFATAAFWGLVILWFVGAALWPLLFDPLRASEPIAQLVRLAATVILVRPTRYLGLMLVVGAILFITTVLAAALVTFAMAFAALLLAGYTIPTADRIEGRRTFVVIS